MGTLCFCEALVTSYCYHLNGILFKKTYARNRTKIPRFPVHRLVTMLTELSQINE